MCIVTDSAEQPGREDLGNVQRWYLQSWGLQGATSSLAPRVRGLGDRSHGMSPSQLPGQAELSQKPGNLGTQAQTDKGIRGVELDGKIAEFLLNKLLNCFFGLVSIMENGARLLEVRGP